MLRKTAVTLMGVVTCFLFVAGCSATPKTGKWSTSGATPLTYDQVFSAAQRAGTDNGFTIVSSDKSAGLISMRKEEYAGKKQAERRMAVQVRQLGSNIAVNTKIVGSDFGVIEGMLGGPVHKELTNNYYVYLFRQLNISNPSEQNFIIEDAK